MRKAPFSMFGKTVDVPVRIFVDGAEVPDDGESWARESWMERPEDWYAFNAWRGERVRVVTPQMWMANRG